MVFVVETKNCMKKKSISDITEKNQYTLVWVWKLSLYKNCPELTTDEETPNKNEFYCPVISQM